MQELFMENKSDRLLHSTVTPVNTRHVGYRWTCGNLVGGTVLNIVED